MNYIQQAYKGKNDFWRYIVAFIIIIIGWQLFGAIPLVVTAVFYSGSESAFFEAAQTNFMNLGIDSNLFLGLMIFMFVIGLAAIFIAVRSIHQRSITSLITSREKIDWKRVFFAFGLWFSISVAMLALGYFTSDPETFTWNFKPIPFIILVLISFLFLPIQTSFEELLFRGYFMQGIGISTVNKFFPLIFIYILVCILSFVGLIRFFELSNFVKFGIIIFFILFLFQLLKMNFLENMINTRLYLKLYSFFNRAYLPLIMTSAAFGLLHGANPEVEKLGYIVMVFYIGTGLFFGMVTLLDEGTELALGLHAANNIAAAVFITHNWTVFQTEALLIDNSEPSVGYETFLPVFVLYPIMLFIFSKKYHWTNWSEKLLGKIEKPTIIKDNFFDEERVLEV